MAYQVYITDNINTVELDTEDIDTRSVFSLLDIGDISARKDNIKSIQFKGTKKNNNAFGTFFDFGRTSDFNIPNNLGFNHNPLRPVTTFVYENGELIFKGSLRINAIIPDGHGNVYYDTILTGAFIDLKTTIQDKYLTDLDFTDLKHHYDSIVVKDSWNVATERYVSSTSGFTSTPFEYGSGYVYPLIDYGYYYTGATDNLYTDVDSANFKPAIYVREYFNRIFSQPSLGFTYEIKGDDDFMYVFNHLVVPDTQEGNKLIVGGTTITMSRPLIIVPFSSYPFRNLLVNLSLISQVSPDLNVNVLEQSPTYFNVTEINRTFTANATVTVNLDCNNNLWEEPNNGDPVPFSVRLMKRPRENTNTFTNWETVGVKTFDVPFTGSGTINQQINFDTSYIEFRDDEQLALGVTIDNGQTFDAGSHCYYVVNTARVVFPATGGTFTVQYNMQEDNGDVITPTPPTGIKQIDFLKSVINQLNLVVYTRNDNYRHIIFEKYDDFYVFTLPHLIKNNSLDWSNKVDYTSGFKIESNINLPKSYTFTYKDDSDYLTDFYKKKFNRVFGSLNFEDSFGLLENKKVELIFSPIIVNRETGDDKDYCAFYKVESNQRKPTRTNIRMGYYNGLIDCSTWSLYRNNVSSYDTYASFTQYPLFSNYLYSGDTVLNDIHFSRALETYGTITNSHLHSNTSYENYYINETTELTNPNVTYINCKIMLNELDIANLDLKIPVYINTGIMNGSYFKVLKVEYESSQIPSNVFLQRIVF